MGGVGEAQVLYLPSGSLLWTIALSVKYPMLGYWAPVTGNEMRSQDKSNTHGKKKLNWGSIFFSPNLVLRGKFHPQFWICLTCCCTAPSLLAHFLYYLTIMPCQKQDPANLLN
jgi:hypothetical protein